MNIVVADYNVGNLSSIGKGLTAVGARVRLVDTAERLQEADGIVLPGVGHFAATASLGCQWRCAVRQAIEADVPVLGICLGLQWLFEGSDEAPDVSGLGLLAGRCFRLGGAVKVPHVGWNTLTRGVRSSRLLEGLPPDSSAYFTHSYAAPIGPDTVATTTHGVPFASAVERRRTFGVQFHPEKSGTTGLHVLRNFLAVVRNGS